MIHENKFCQKVKFTREFYNFCGKTRKMLEGLKVIELATVLAGPHVGMFFAELGAEVIKIEHPTHPDVTRSWKLPTEKQTNSVSAYFSSVNYKKNYIRLDLTRTEDLVELKLLLKDADVLLTNFKKGDDIKFGLTDQQLKKLNPSLIIGKISGFGSDSDRVAYDLILQAETGFMAMNGGPDSGPVKMPVALIDVLAAHHLKEGILVALLRRMKTGKGGIVAVSLYDAAVSSLVNQASNYLMNKHIPQRIGSLHPNIAPYGELFKTRDGDLITFAIGSNTHFEKLCEILELSELVGSPLYKTNQDRVKNRTLLAEALSNKVAVVHTSTLLDKLSENLVPCAKIKNLKEVFKESAATQLIREEIIENQKTKRVTSIAFRYE
jgi:crotonobetainyl-CoA:carnitine CoA-transferase CaiB-like acyl-CoA transferase